MSSECLSQTHRTAARTSSWVSRVSSWQPVATRHIGGMWREMCTWTGREECRLARGPVQMEQYEKRLVRDASAHVDRIRPSRSWQRTVLHATRFASTSAPSPMHSQIAEGNGSSRGGLRRTSTHVGRQQNSAPSNQDGVQTFEQASADAGKSKP